MWITALIAGGLGLISGFILGVLVAVESIHEFESRRRGGYVR